jgi:hypothetical protein
MHVGFSFAAYFISLGMNNWLGIVYGNDDVGTGGEASSNLLVQRYIPDMVFANIEGLDLNVVIRHKIEQSSQFHSPRTRIECNASKKGG